MASGARIEILSTKRGRNAGGWRGPDGSADATGASYRLMQINVAVLPPFASEGAGVASGANGGRARIDDFAPRTSRAVP